MIMLLLLLFYVIGCFVGYSMITTYFGEDLPPAKGELVIILATIGSWITLLLFFINFLIQKDE